MTTRSAAQRTALTRCCNCPNPAERDRVRCGACAALQRQTAAARYALLKALGLCVCCKADLSAQWRDAGHAYCLACTGKYAQYNQRTRSLVKLLAVLLLSARRARVGVASAA